MWSACSFAALLTFCFPPNRHNLFVEWIKVFCICLLGKPLDLMARRVLAAATKELAEELSPYLDCNIDLPRD